MRQDEVFKVGQVWRNYFGEEFEVVSTELIAHEALNVRLKSLSRNLSKDEWAYNMWLSGYRKADDVTGG